MVASVADVYSFVSHLLIYSTQLYFLTRKTHILMQLMWRPFLFYFKKMLQIQPVNLLLSMTSLDNTCTMVGR